jgi:hypothetical protein
MSFQFRLGLSLCFRLSPSTYESCRQHARVMESFDLEPFELVQVMIPRWTHNRIEELLVAAQSAAETDDYIVAVLEGHVRRLNL